MKTINIGNNYIFDHGDAIEIISFIFKHVVLVLNGSVDLLTFSHVLKFDTFFDRYINTESIKSWLNKLADNLRIYSKSIHTFRPYVFITSDCHKGYDILIKNKSRTNIYERISFDFVKDEYEFYDEFGLVFTTFSIETFLRTLCEVHPGLEIPEYRWGIYDKQK